MKKINYMMLAGFVLLISSFTIQSCNSNGVEVSDSAKPILINGSTGENTSLYDPYPGGGVGKDTTIKRDTSIGGNDKVKTRPLPIDCLGLDSTQLRQLKVILSQQEVLIRIENENHRKAFAELRIRDSISLVKNRQEINTFQSQMKEMQSQYNRLYKEITEKVKSGIISEEEANKQIKELRSQFENSYKELRAKIETSRAVLKNNLSATTIERKRLNQIHQTRIKTIQEETYLKIANILTPEQLIKWNIWLKGGNPCELVIK